MQNNVSSSCWWFDTANEYLMVVKFIQRIWKKCIFMTTTILWWGCLFKNEQGSELFQVLNKFFLILKHLLGLLCSPHVLLLNHHQLYSYLLSYNKKKRKVWHKSFNTARGSVHHHSLFVVCLDIVVCRGT